MLFLINLVWVKFIAPPSDTAKCNNRTNLFTKKIICGFYQTFYSTLLKLHSAWTSTELWLEPAL